MCVRVNYMQQWHLLRICRSLHVLRGDLHSQIYFNSNSNTHKIYHYFPMLLFFSPSISRSLILRRSTLCLSLASSCSHSANYRPHLRHTLALWAMCVWGAVRACDIQKIYNRELPYASISRTQAASVWARERQTRLGHSVWCNAVNAKVVCAIVLAI